MARVTLVVPAPLSLSGQVQLPIAANSLPGHIRIPRSAYVPGRDVFLMIYGRGSCSIDTAWINIGDELRSPQFVVSNYAELPCEILLDGTGKDHGSVLFYRIEPQGDAVIHGFAVEMEVL